MPIHSVSRGNMNIPFNFVLEQKKSERNFELYFKCITFLFKSNQMLCGDLVKGYIFSLRLTLDRSGGQGAFNTCYYIIFYKYEWMTQYFTWWNYVINPDSLPGWHGVRSDLFGGRKKNPFKGFYSCVWSCMCLLWKGLTFK